MPDEPNDRPNEEATLAVPGILCVSPSPSGRKVIRIGPAAGWMVPSGVARWERELSFMARADMTAGLARALHATLPHEQIARTRFPMADNAVRASPLLALASNLVEGARKQGVRVHTVGVDRVSGDLFYFAEGGSKTPVNVQGNLVEMLAPSLNASSTNADIHALLEGLVDRLLTVLSGGVVSELDLELADALPRLSRDGTGLVGTNLEAFDAQARRLADGAARHESALRQIADLLAAAARLGQSSARVPLYGEARQASSPPLEVRVGGKSVPLPARSQWTVTGAPRDQPEKVRTVAAPDVPSAPSRSSGLRTPPSANERAAAARDQDKPAALSAPSAPAPHREVTPVPSPPPVVDSPPVPVVARAKAATDRESVAAQPATTPRPIPEPVDTPLQREPVHAVAPSAPAVRPDSTRSSAWVPMFLLLAFAAAVGLMWNSLH
jgi:hypothetical protein